MDIAAWRRFVDGLELRHFSGAELAAYASRTRNGVRNDPPPRNLWNNLVPTLQVADLLRDATGTPFAIWSAYRSPLYNGQVGGAVRSLHLRNNALDLHPVGASPQTLFNLLKKWRDAGVFVGGLGIYTSFVHLDTRGILGMENATWEG